MWQNSKAWRKSLAKEYEIKELEITKRNLSIMIEISCESSKRGTYINVKGIDVNNKIMHLQ